MREFRWYGNPPKVDLWKLRIVAFSQFAMACFHASQYFDYVYHWIIILVKIGVYLLSELWLVMCS